MKFSFRRITGWLDRRTGIETAIRNFLDEDIPASTSWPQASGSVALFLFLTQAFTGILLALNFAPTAGDAYNSLQYIVREVVAGQMIRGLHHWGATMMIIVVVLHMTQVFLCGAYKKPREATWHVGVVLLLMTLGFGLTGYLLPWDNRAYWGTVVTTQIAATIPIIGAYLERLIGAEDGVGVVTFARFYGLHVQLLPAVTVLLIGIHIHLVRRHGITRSAFDDRPDTKFHPEQTFKDIIAVFVAFVILFALAVFARVPLERLADPTDSSYIPRPDWYFLFLFQILKLFKGTLEPIGSFLLPTLGVGLLFILPFVDDGRLRRVRERTVAITLVLAAYIGWGTLTAAAIVGTPKQNTKELNTAGSAQQWIELSPEELAGIGYFRQEHCESCHNLADGEPKPGPDLVQAHRRTAEWLIEHFRNPGQIIPGSNMPPIRLTDVQLNVLSAFLLKLTPENAKALNETPNSAVLGAQIYLVNGCAGCHRVNGVGGSIGPSLNRVAKRRSKEWVEQYFLNPKALVPGSLMPSFQFSSHDRDILVAYLLSLPGR
ncbi:MAG: cytochrome b N-terminal domain-containing protein [Bryobacteraceae bacterium]